jgi:xanthine/uracil permease
VKLAHALGLGDNFMSSDIHPVDEILPVPKLLTLGLQHVLVMYAGAVAVPLILGRALKLSPEDVAFLISADLFACGIATLVRSIGFPGVGIRLPVMMGVTFASVGPMLSMAASPDIGLLGIYGSVIGAGLFAFLAAPFISRLLPLFPPVVTGTVILVIGISSVLLDAFFNGVRSIASARSEAAMVAAASGHV